MKNLILLTMTCGLSFGAISASARDYEQRRDYQHDQRIALTWPWSGQLDEEVNRLNRMRGHIRWQLRNHKANRDIRREFAEVSQDIDRINSQFRNGVHNRRQLRHEIERARAALHRIELALNLRTRDHYSWR